MRLPPPPAPPRSPWQLLYGSAHAARRRWWARRARRLPRPVVSVGNLHWGGTGKTPVTAAVAGHLRDRGLRVAILSRGYGRSRREAARGVRVVSTGDGPLLGPSVAGDEPVLLAGELPGVAVLVAAERREAGLHAMAHLDPPPDLFVLDDGFSHLRLARDVDLLVFPVTDPWAGGRLPPGGRLREPLGAAGRAHGALLTGPLPAGEETELAAALGRGLGRYGFRGAAFAAPGRSGPPRHASGGRAPGEELPPDAPVLLVAGVARPEGFLRAVRETGQRVVGELRFPDHHPYPEATLARIRTAYRELGARAVLTTGKDRVKLHGRLDLPLAELPFRADPEPAFWTWLDERLAAAGPEREGSGRGRGAS